MTRRGRRRATRRHWRWFAETAGLVGLLAGAAVLGGCVSNPPLYSTRSSPTTVAHAVLSSEPTPLGRILATGTGYTLYDFVLDSSRHTACVSALCTQLWPPVRVSGRPRVVGPGVDLAKVGTLRRPGGSLQLTYAGHPLYTWASDTAPGMVTGQAKDNAGGLWYVVSVSGRPITAPFSVESRPPP